MTATLDDMRLFAELAEAGSITGAARRLGTTKQTVSRRLAELEHTLGVELARRTTRRLTLTDVGRAYAGRCLEVVRLADEANEHVASHGSAVSGRVRVTADHVFGETFLPSLVASFLERFPDVALDVWLTSRKVDLIEEGFDVAFRVGPPPDVLHLSARRLGPARLVTVAAPTYLKRRGTPRAPSDLNDHDCLMVVGQLPAAGWPFVVDGRLALVPIAHRLAANGLEIARRTAVAGGGVAHLPAFAVVDDLASGRLRRLLKPFAPEVGGVHVVTPTSRLLAPKVTELVAAAVAHFSEYSVETTPGGRSRQRTRRAARSRNRR